MAICARTDTDTALFSDTDTELRTDIKKYRQNTDTELNNRTDPALDHTVTSEPYIYIYGSA
jgi:hypothetical protein